LNYSIEEHKHRFASWAASRGASTSPKCRFEVELGKILLEQSGLQEIAQSINSLPNPNEFDIQHRIWRNKIIDIAEQHQKKFTHGIAAKLINLYLKSIFVCGENINNNKIKTIHPPIDSILLEELYKQNIGNQKEAWNKAKKTRWSKFNSDDYEEVIQAIKISIKEDTGLWEIEQYWQGYQ
jgi:hypothetical protein